MAGAGDKAGLLQRGDEETSVQHTVRTHQPQHRAHHQHQRRRVSPSCRRRRRAQDRQEGETPSIVNYCIILVTNYVNLKHSNIYQIKTAQPLKFR